MSNPQKIRGSATGNAVITQEIKEALAKAINNGINSKLVSYKKNYKVFINAYRGGVTASMDYPKFFKNRRLAEYDIEKGLLYLFFKGVGEERVVIQAQKLVTDSVCKALQDLFGFNIFVSKFVNTQGGRFELLISIRDGNRISQIKYKCKDISKDVMIEVDTKMKIINKIEEVEEC